ncbi:hypothetical protein [Polymorphobacter megasporae]|uniref:hypothetical protein n=1 Tax=Glacieibacterium megasporae TaxID=2835787 RepID=UPI001C1E2879|nr:hypothetical protein [Polymorphobacter megasporae]UAJ13003.1 hypothetical protein KTC28_22540 [Polymorphobacter megasporae]
MAKKSSALAGVFDDEPEAPSSQAAALQAPIQARPESGSRLGNSIDTPALSRRSSHPGKKPVLIHIPEDMHRTLRQLSVEEGGEPLTVVTERLLRQYLVERGHARFAP